MRTPVCMPVRMPVRMPVNMPVQAEYANQDNERRARQEQQAAAWKELSDRREDARLAGITAAPLNRATGTFNGDQQAPKRRRHRRKNRGAAPENRDQTSHGWVDPNAKQIRRSYGKGEGELKMEAALATARKMLAENSSLSIAFVSGKVPSIHPPTPGSRQAAGSRQQQAARRHAGTQQQAGRQHAAGSRQQAAEGLYQMCLHRYQQMRGSMRRVCVSDCGGD